jgi:hypothetical protein
VDTKLILQIVKSYKLSFDTLGYAVVEGKITTDRHCYRYLLRSGKNPAPAPKSTCDREYQTLDFYKRFFDDRQRIMIKWLVLYILKGVQDKHFKPTIKISRKLLKLGYLKVWELPDGKLIKDIINGCEFYYSSGTKKVYRMTKNGGVVDYHL